MFTFDGTSTEILTIFEWLCQLRVRHWLRICRARDFRYSFIDSHFQGGPFDGVPGADRIWVGDGQLAVPGFTHRTHVP